MRYRRKGALKILVGCSHAWMCCRLFTTLTDDLRELKLIRPFKIKRHSAVGQPYLKLKMMLGNHLELNILCKGHPVRNGLECSSAVMPEVNSSGSSDPVSEMASHKGLGSERCSVGLVIFFRTFERVSETSADSSFLLRAARKGLVPWIISILTGPHVTESGVRIDISPKVGCFAFEPS